MTPEKLNEIEKRWAGYLEKNEVERRFLFDHWWDKRDFWDMTKALREAWEARDVLQAVLNDWQRFGMEREKERDEARAEVEMIRGVGCGELREGAEIEDGPCGACLKCARRERDEARAEVERLRGVVRQVCVEAETALDAMESFWPGSTIHAAINDIHALTKEKP